MIHLIFALIFSLFGFLIYFFPNLIAGYNTMSKEQKANVNIAQLKKIYLISTLIFAAGFALGGGFELGGIEFNFWYYFSLIALYIIVLTVVGHYCDHNPQKETGKKMKRLIISIFVIIFGAIAIAFAILQGMKDTNTTFENNALVINGMYGKKVSLESVHSIEKIDTFPIVYQKTNGFSSGKTRKGYFRIQDWGKTLMFVSNVKNPVVHIQLNNDKHILINFKSEEKTDLFFKKFNRLLE